MALITTPQDGYWPISMQIFEKILQMWLMLDWMVEADQVEYEFIIRQGKGNAIGVTPEPNCTDHGNMALSERAVTNYYGRKCFQSNWV